MKASSGVQTIGSPLTLNDVLTTTAHPVFSLNLVISAWYFGMDAYELVTQLSYKLKDNKIIESLNEMIPSIQRQIDLGYLSDNMVFAGIPIKPL